jgi:hypothetical protein
MQPRGHGNTDVDSLPAPSSSCCGCGVGECCTLILTGFLLFCLVIALISPPYIIVQQQFYELYLPSVPFAYSSSSSSGAPFSPPGQIKYPSQHNEERHRQQRQGEGDATQLSLQPRVEDLSPSSSSLTPPPHLPAGMERIPGNGVAFLLFYWQGIIVYWLPNEGPSSYRIIPWGTSTSSSLNLSHTTTTFFISMSFSLLSFVLTVAWLIFFICTYIIPTTRRSFGHLLYRCCNNNNNIYYYGAKETRNVFKMKKFIVMGLLGLVLVVHVIGWAFFISISNGLEGDNFQYCDGQLWCNSFVGLSSTHLDPLFLAKSEIYWGPSVGWFVSVLSTVWYLVVIGFVRTIDGSSGGHESNSDTLAMAMYHPLEPYPGRDSDLPVRRNSMNSIYL